MSIYVEILIRCGMDDLWGKTQDPKPHQRWDLRFSEIDYLPRQSGEAQRFLYKTRIGGGCGLKARAKALGSATMQPASAHPRLNFGPMIPSL